MKLRKMVLIVGSTMKRNAKATAGRTHTYGRAVACNRRGSRASSCSVSQRYATMRSGISTTPPIAATIRSSIRGLLPCASRSEREWLAPTAEASTSYFLYAVDCT